MQKYYIASTAAYQVSISSTAYKVLSYLQQCADYKTRTCYPKRKTIAAKCGISVRSVVRAVNDLCVAGLLKRKFQFAFFVGDNSIRQKENLYTLIDSPQISLQGRNSTAMGNFSKKSKNRFKGRIEDNILYRARSANLSALTGNEVKVFNYITLRAGKGCSCFLSKKEIAAGCAISTVTVYRCIKKLANKGLLDVQAQTRKSITGDNGTTSNLYTILPLPRRPKLAAAKFLFAFLLNRTLGYSPISPDCVTGGHIKLVTPRTLSLKNKTLKKEPEWKTKFIKSGRSWLSKILNTNGKA
jgi:predicted transcriptional regulator